MNEQRRRHHLSTIFSILIAGAFLYLAFRNISPVELVQHFSGVHVGELFLLITLVILGVFLRATRWWYTLPRPLEAGEFWAAQRALGIGYALNNIAPRAGEVARVITLSRASGRSYAGITSTVIVDRMLLDLLAMCGLLSLCLVLNRQALTEMLPGAQIALNTLAVMALTAMIGMLWFALKPHQFKGILVKLGLPKFDFLWSRLAPTLDSLSEGMEIMTQPKHYLAIFMLTILLWLSYFGMFAYALRVFGIEFNWSDAFLVYTVTVIGFAIPSPGGIGGYHYFTKLGLVTVLGVGEVKALAFAAFAHGANYLTIIAYGLLCFLLGRKGSATQPSDQLNHHGASTKKAAESDA